ncbi:MAG: hypothetical protein H6718_08780 [Polyangiaceae bacterium]|nr:hypothetical protein [Myxococcales bacterium]MCB9585479.1 hypothetical protein [Polyangiaceae bacterium]MCB9606505.1 hypothetical protein [Polyangiaceae bacterium]
MASNKRASREAIQKRRAGRALNDLFAGRGNGPLDGRTEKRRQRLLEELRENKRRGSGEELKPLEVLSHANELLDMGETVVSLRKLCAQRKPPGDRDQLVYVVRQVHEAYGFRSEVWGLVGVADEVLREAGVPLVEE